jgi:hypothetical protein
LHCEAQSSEDTLVSMPRLATANQFCSTILQVSRSRMVSASGFRLVSADFVSLNRPPACAPALPPGTCLRLFCGHHCPSHPVRRETGAIAPLRCTLKPPRIFSQSARVALIALITATWNYCLLGLRPLLDRMSFRAQEDSRHGGHRFRRRRPTPNQ